MNEQEWTNALNRLEKDEIGPPDMVWRTADGTEKRELIYTWPDGPEKSVMELYEEELLILANAHERLGNRLAGGHATPESPLKDQG